jgi:hypothetical protein
MRPLPKLHLRCTRKGYAANSMALKRRELRNHDYVCLLAYPYVRGAAQASLFLRN